MQILLWLLPAALATLAAMAWVAWVGREKELSERDQERQRQRLEEALRAPLPKASQSARTHERSSGVAVRPSEVRRTHDAA